MEEATAGKVFISRKPETKHPDSFAALREAGIKQLEALCGDVWSDYNPHDPGVTILEQLCYALTELIYRNSFDTADYLTGPDGRIEFEKLALHRPESVFPCRPTTDSDYRRALLDAVPSIDNVWLSNDWQPVARRQARAAQGLHPLIVRVESDSPEERLRAADAVKQAYLARRNLCEDILGTVLVAPVIPVELHATIEFDGTRLADDVLAEIFHDCAALIAADVKVTPLRESLDADVSLEELLSGPLAGIGQLEERRFGSEDDVIQIADLVAAVSRIDSVVTVTALWIESGSAEDRLRHHEVLQRFRDGRVLQLRVPKPGEPDCHVRLTKNGRPFDALAEDLWRKYAELDFKARERRQARTQIHSLYTPPSGSYRDFSRYHSLQNQFPNVYGISAEGVPGSAPAADHGRAAQLKAYLMLFEQLLADHGENTEHLADLFSTEPGTSDSYHWRFLDADLIPGAERVIGNEELARRYHDETMRSLDDHTERRSRLYDHMLAAYGESFMQSSLRGFDHYYDREETDSVVVENKLEYLRAVTTITRDRAAAFDYTRSTCLVPLSAREGPNVSGLEYRASLLLGFRQRDQRSLVAPVSGCEYVSAYESPDDDELSTAMSGETAELERLLQAFVGDISTEAIEPDDSFHRVPDCERSEKAAFTRLPEGLTVPSFRSARKEQLLAVGVRAERYRIGRCPQSSDGDESYVVAFSDGEDRWWRLATVEGRTRAEHAARALRSTLIRLNVNCEGMHLLEHILLRPFAGGERHFTKTPDWNEALWENFYPLRFSVMLPAWTARCRDPNFRLLAEETFALNAPAHTFGQCLWLETDEMSAFEQSHGEWLRLRRDRNATVEAIDAAAVDLVDQLLGYQARARDASKL